MKYLQILFLCLYTHKLSCKNVTYQGIWVGEAERSSESEITKHKLMTNVIHETLKLQKNQNEQTKR